MKKNLTNETVKNREGSEILPYLQANKLSCQCYGCWQKIHNSWARDKDCITHNSISDQTPHFTQDDKNRAAQWLQTQCVRLQEKNPEFRKHKSFIMVSTQACPLPWKKTLSLSSKLFTTQTSLKKIIQNKGSHCLCSQGMLKCKWLLENYLPTERYVEIWCRGFVKDFSP